VPAVRRIKPAWRARRAKRHDRLVAVEIFADCRSAGVRGSTRKQLVENSDVVRHQRLLIARELRGQPQRARPGDRPAWLDPSRPWRRHGRQRVPAPGATRRRDIFPPTGAAMIWHARSASAQAERATANHRKANEGNRLGVDTDYWPRTVKLKRRRARKFACPSFGRDAMVVAGAMMTSTDLNNSSTCVAGTSGGIFWRAIDQRRWNHRSRQQPVRAPAGSKFVSAALAANRSRCRDAPSQVEMT